MVSDQRALLAVMVGLASAAAFAASNALQHRVAGTVPSGGSGLRPALEVLGRLACRPLWLSAMSVSFVAVSLHALALRIGAIALVQTLMIGGVVLAVPLRAALDRKLPTRPELQGVAVTAVGLALFLWSAAPSEATAEPSTVRAVPLVVSGVAVALYVVGTRGATFAGRRRVQAAALGTASGVQFGLTAGLLKLFGLAVAAGVTGLGLVGPLVGLVAVGLCGITMNQRAYQVAPLAFVAPVINVVDVLVALLFGFVVFHEAPAHGPTGVVVQVAALGCVAVGLRLISRLPHLSTQAA